MSEDENIEERLETTEKVSDEQKLLSIGALASYENQLKVNSGKQKSQNSRTPSGTNLSGRVRGIKEFLQTKNYPSLGAENTCEGQIDEDIYHDEESATNKCKLVNRDETADCNQQVLDAITLGLDHEEFVNKKRKHDQSPEIVKPTTGLLKEGECEVKTPIKEKTSSTKRYKCSKEEMDTSVETVNLEQILDMYGVKENAKVIDVRTVLEMFHQVMSKRNSTVEDQTLHQWKIQLKDEINKDVNASFEAYEEKIKKLEEDLCGSDRKLKIVQDVITRQNDIIKDLTKRMDAVELNQARRMAVLTGLSTSQKKHERTKEVTEFLQTELEIFTRIEDTYQLNADPPTIVVTFQTMHDKETAFEKKSKLKDISKDRGKKLYLNHYLPIQENEKRKRERKIVGEAKSEKLSTEYTAKGLKIGESIYKKKVNAPDPVELLSYTTQELDAILKTFTMKGAEYRSKDSVFIPYAIDVKDFESIRAAYMKLRLLHARA